MLRSSHFNFASQRSAAHLLRFIVLALQCTQLGRTVRRKPIIDAETLAKNLKATTSDAAGALKAYEFERLPPTAKIVMANRANGSDQVLQLCEERAPYGFNNVYDVVPQEELETIGTVCKKVAGF